MFALSNFNDFLSNRFCVDLNCLNKCMNCPLDFRWVDFEAEESCAAEQPLSILDDKSLLGVLLHHIK